MGIPGLTTFIRNHHEHCMTDYELANTPVILDANATICYLYENNLKNGNDFFGGDYDRLAQVVFNFFELLSSCNITPYLVFDGGYSIEKIPLGMKRMRQRVEQIDGLKNRNFSESKPVFPLHMFSLFETIGRKLNIKMVRCTFDCDLECANIGRALNCPVLSNNSDFYLCDILYIPLSTLKMEVCNKGSTNYISCQIYHLDRFLKYFDLKKKKLPLLAVLVGNDYTNEDDGRALLYSIKKEVEGGFYENRIQLTISWLQQNSTKSAIEKISDKYDFERNKRLQNAICYAYKTYTCCESQYLKYLGLEVSKYENFGVGNDCRSTVDINENLNHISEHFLENFKKGFYPSPLMNIAYMHRFFCYPQVDDFRLDDAHRSSLEIIGAIHKILTKSQGTLVYLGRTQGARYEEFKMPLVEINVPYIDEIKHMDVGSRQKIIAAVLNLNETTFTNLLNNFPESWHVFILAIKYIKVKTRCPSELMVALILCKLILGHIDDKIGIYRSRTVLHEKYPHVVESSGSYVESNIRGSLLNIPLDNCLYCLDSFMHFFNFAPNFSQSHTRLDYKLIHRMSQFQDCFLYLIYLDQLLEDPLIVPLISECLNCTFVYQLTKYLAETQNFYEELRLLTKHSPVIYQIVIMSVKLVNGVIDHEAKSKWTI